MHALPSFDDSNLLIGAEHFSDAGVYRLADDLAMVQSLDFFPPVVDDPYTYGRIAAANALSDVYALGGRPTTAMNIVGYPDDQLPIDVLGEILAGGAERVRAAGAVIVGGHSVRDVEIKYGLSVTGLVDPRKMLTNAGAQAGDVLVLTKALGTGYITTANRAGKCVDEVLQGAIDSMVALNDVAAKAAVEVGGHAVTDITGFGLGGHAFEMAQASEVTIHIQVGKLPMLAGVETVLTNANQSRANATNREHVAASMRIDGGEGLPQHRLLFDPQTSGGLLIAVAADRAEELVQRCHAAGQTVTAIVGRIETKGDVDLVIEV